jgi:glycosyltransferase involved in cell wall biosynthesis
VANINGGDGKMKVLIQWAGGFDTPGPSNHLLKSLIEDLISAGINVHLIQGSIKKIGEEIPSDFKNLKGFTFHTLERKDIAKRNFVKRYLEEILYVLRSVRCWKKVHGIDVVFIRSSPTSLYGILLAKLFFKKQVLYGVQDMWPGSAVNSGVLNNKLVAKFFYMLQKIAYKFSDKITVISEDMKTKVLEQGVPEEKVYPIVNWFDDRTVHEVPWVENRFVKKYGLDKDKFYVQYAGTMGYVFDYKMVLTVAEKLRSYKGIEFHMIGQGSQKDSFVNEAKNRGLDNIKFFPLEPQHMVSDVYSACSVCLIPLKRGIIGNSVPSKAGLLMACNRAIVNSVDEDSDYYKMFNENEIGFSASNNDPEAVVEAILELYNNKERRELFAKNGQKFGENYYARSVNTKKFIEIFEDMVKEK